MKYFLVRQDKNNQDLPRIVRWYNDTPYRNYKKDTFLKMPKRTLLEIDTTELAIFSDIITSPFILFSKMCKNVISLYNNKIQYKELVLMNFQYRFNEHYYLPQLPTADCLTSESEFNLDKSVCRKIVIDGNKVANKSIFLLGGLKSDYLIMRMDLIESLLRRNAVGLWLEEVQIEEDN